MDATGDAARAALARTRARRERNERVDRGKENDVVDDDDDAKVDRERYVRVTTGDDANGRRRERRKELAMRWDAMGWRVVVERERERERGEARGGRAMSANESDRTLSFFLFFFARSSRVRMKG